MLKLKSQSTILIQQLAMIDKEADGLKEIHFNYSTVPQDRNKITIMLI